MSGFDFDGLVVDCERLAVHCACVCMCVRLCACVRACMCKVRSFHVRLLKRERAQRRSVFVSLGSVRTLYSLRSFSGLLDTMSGE